MTFIYIIVALFFYLQIRSLQTRIKDLEGKMKGGEAVNERESVNEVKEKASLWNADDLEKGTGDEGRFRVRPGMTDDIGMTSGVGIANAAAMSVEKKTSMSVEDGIEKLIEWLKEDWILKLGALLLLMGFGWLARYAFLNNWIGPQGRIALGIFAGTVILAFGFYRARKYLNQGSVFLVLGSSTVLLTIFAARNIYQFFTPTCALVIMFLASAFVAFASLTYKNKWLSLASIILASMAPLLTNSPSPDYIGLFSYLFVITLGTVWITFISLFMRLAQFSLQQVPQIC